MTPRVALHDTVYRPNKLLGGGSAVSTGTDDSDSHGEVYPVQFVCLNGFDRLLNQFPSNLERAVRSPGSGCRMDVPHGPQRDIENCFSIASTIRCLGTAVVMFSSDSPSGKPLVPRSHFLTGTTPVGPDINDHRPLDARLHLGRCARFRLGKDSSIRLLYRVVITRFFPGKTAPGIAAARTYQTGESTVNIHPPG